MKQQVPNLSEKPTLQEIQSHLTAVCKERGWDKKTISQVYLLLAEEVGELAKEVRKRLDFETDQIDITQNKHEVEGEIADIFNYLLEIASRFDIDLAEAYMKKQKINKDRSWDK